MQVFAGGLVATNGIIEPGDEISHVNDIALVGKDRREVATIIKKCEVGSPDENTPFSVEMFQLVDEQSTLTTPAMLAVLNPL